MNDPIAISVHGVSKCYHVYENQRARLRHALFPSNTNGLSEVWALRDISFEVKRGESVAIIGRNGAGKSTLLEIITRTLTPTTGEVHVHGRLAALLELGSGFNPEYTGRENVVLNGLVLGLSRAEVERRFDDIASFADIGDVLDRPVKTYSSGMLVRLAFAVQVALEPEILIVDEALSVGDYFFQQKCFGRLRQMRDNGLTMLFVSHDMGTVRDTCERAVYLKQGVQAYQGEALEAIQRYFSDGRLPSTQRTRLPAPSPLESLDPDVVRKLSAHALWSRAAEETIRLVAVHVLDLAGNHVAGVSLGSTVVIRVYLRLLGSGLPLDIGIVLKNKYDQIIFSMNNRLLGMKIIDSNEQSISAFEFEMDMAIEAGLYSLKITCSDPTASSAIGATEESGWIGPLRIDWDYEGQQPPFFGMFGIPVRGRGLTSDGEAFQ